jgi:UDP-N-acetyl-D-glucosamine dehydrogenase
VSDTRESPALDVIGLLRDKEADVKYYDPNVPSLDHEGWILKSVPDLLEAVQQTDCVVVITDHDSVDYVAVAELADMIFDTRDALRNSGIEDPKVVRL